MFFYRHTIRFFFSFFFFCVVVIYNLITRSVWERLPVDPYRVHRLKMLLRNRTTVWAAKNTLHLHYVTTLLLHIINRKYKFLRQSKSQKVTEREKNDGKQIERKIPLNCLWAGKGWNWMTCIISTACYYTHFICLFTFYLFIFLRSIEAVTNLIKISSTLFFWK